jgi:hypothetical protein
LRHKFVAGFLRGGLRGIEHAHEFRGDLRLAGAGALHLGYAGELGFVAGAGGLRVGAGGADQAGGGPLLVVQQGFEEVFGRDALVEVAYGDGLRGLQKAAGALGEFLDVHVCPFRRRRRCHAPGRRRGPVLLNTWASGRGGSRVGRMRLLCGFPLGVRGLAGCVHQTEFCIDSQRFLA